MTQTTFHMENQINAVDQMVLALRSAVEGVLEQDILFRFEISVAEALTNLVEHATNAVAGANIDVTITINDACVRVEIYDPEGATPFDLRPHACDLSEVDQMAEGGRGLGLIMQCADAVDYGPTGHRHRLALEFIKTGK